MGYIFSEFQEMNRQMNLRAETWQRSQGLSNFRHSPKHGREPRKQLLHVASPWPDLDTGMNCLDILNRVPVLQCSEEN